MSESIAADQRRQVVERALLKIQELKARLAGFEARDSEPIAVVGLACRFPGGATCPEQFWELLHEGREAISEVPAARWDAAALFDPDPRTPGKMNTRWGGFLDADVGQFDAALFGISPREAMSLDPQQRLLLELTWEVLEHAGQGAAHDTGVFVGISANDYAQSTLFAGPEQIDVYTATGAALSAAAGRLAYQFGFRGPALVLDTACSSSLVAVHLACRSLRSRECRTALAGGVSLILEPHATIATSRARMLAADGRCKVFDATADGYVRSEGGGLVALKRLSDALADRDRVWAVLAGSAVNQNGSGGGLTVPSSPAQQELIRAALEAAAVDPAEFSYLEAHGTGTSLGDPVEIDAVKAVLAHGRPTERPCAIGSVKTNIGHLEAAAGIAGLIKVILALAHDEIPPHLHLRRLNPNIDLASTRLIVPTAPRPWSSGDGRRFAGVSSFGFSGTNAHVIVADPPRAAPATAPSEPTAPDPASRPWLVTLSAAGEASLREVAGRLRRHLQSHPSLRLPDVSFTCATGRAHLTHRAAVSARSTRELADRLAAIEASEVRGVMPGGRPAVSGPPKVVFSFPGGEAGYAGMARRLFACEPAFRRTLQRFDETLRPHLSFSLLSLLEWVDDGSAVDRTAFAPLALVAVECALADLWRSWGIEPWAVQGSGDGEYAAAYAAGIFGWEDALTLVAGRCRLLASHSVLGASVPLPADVTGAREQSGAPGLDSLLADFEQLAGHVRYSAPRVRIVSDVTERVADAALMASACYWRRQWCEPIRRAQSLETSLESTPHWLVEIGPPSARLASEGPGEQGPRAHRLASLDPGGDDCAALLRSLGALYVAGREVRWEALFADVDVRRVALPTYPFQRRRYWMKETAEPPRPAVSVPRRRVDHPFLGEHILAPTDAAQFEAVFRASSLPLVDDHRIQGAPWVNMVIYLEAALSAAREGFQIQGATLESVEVAHGLVLPPGESRLVYTSVERAGEVASFRIASFVPRPEEGTRWPWVLHARGVIRPGAESRRDAPALLDVEAIRARCEQEWNDEDYYDLMQRDGAQLGPACRRLERVWRTDGEALGRLKPSRPPGNGDPRTVLPLADIDGCLQMFAALLPVDGPRRYLLAGIEQFDYFGRPGSPPRWCHATLRPGDGAGGTVAADLCLFDEQRQVVAELSGARLQRVERGDGLTPEAGGTAAPAAGTPRLTRADLLGMDAARRHQVLSQYFQEELERALGDPGVPIEPEEPLADQIDSLIAVEIKGRVQEDLHLDLPLSTILEGISLSRLVARLCQHIESEAGAGSANARTSSQAAPPPDGASDPAVMSVARMRAEAVLDPAIDPQRALPPGQHPPRAVLLTGATGFLGAYLLRELLDRTEATVFCLTRAEDEDHARQLLGQNLRRYRIATEGLDRCAVVVGDLARPRLGLSASQAEQLAEEVDAIYHSDALVKWTFDYAAHKPHNVAGTAEILRLACQRRLKPVHHISTVGVFSSPAFSHDVVLESTPLEESGPLSVGYAQSKWIAERLVALADERGLPTRIYRPNLGADSRTGSFNRHDHIYLLLQGCVRMGVAPLVDFRVQAAAVDYVARAVVHLSLRAGTELWVSHLVNQSGLTWDDLVRWVDRRVVPLRPIPYAEWVERLRESIREDPAHPLRNLSPFFCDGTFATVRLPLFDDRQTRRALAGSGLACPALDEPFLQRCFVANSALITPSDGNGVLH